MTEIKVENVLTKGEIGVGDQLFAIENNVWLIGDDNDVIVIDASHEAKKIAAATAERNVLGILLTHGHEDHINAARETAALLDTQVYLHPADLFLWNEIYDDAPDQEIADGQEFQIADLTIKTIHTPGHTPGSVCFEVLGQGVIFSGDTLFNGGPGATRWEYSDFNQIIDSIKNGLFVLDDDNKVLPGHGALTTIAAEKANLEAYVARGW